MVCSPAVGMNGGGRNSMVAADDSGLGQLGFLACWRCSGGVEASRASSGRAARLCQTRGDVRLLQLTRYTANQGIDNRRDSAALGSARFWAALCRTVWGALVIAIQPIQPRFNRIEAGLSRTNASIQSHYSSPTLNLQKLKLYYKLFQALSKLIQTLLK
jgi:hypothetical protein